MDPNLHTSTCCFAVSRLSIQGIFRIFFSCGATQGRRHNCVNTAFEVAFEHQYFNENCLIQLVLYKRKKSTFEEILLCWIDFELVILDLYGISFHAVVFFILEFKILGRD